MTPARKKALRIIREETSPEHPWIRPGWFAHKMWPDSPSWSRCSNVGHGSTTGVGIRQRGGSFLMALVRDGLCSYGGWEQGYRLTSKGREIEL